MRDHLEILNRAIASSVLVQHAAILRRTGTSVIEPRLLRSLRKGEVTQLESQGNWSADWSLVKVHQHFRSDAVRNNRFGGRVILGTFSGDQHDLGDGVRLANGVFDSTLRDVEIGDDAVIHRVNCLQQSVVAAGAAVVNCSTITCAGPTCYGSGTEIPLGVQTGQRMLRSFPELDVELARRLTMGPQRRELMIRYNDLIDEYLARVRGERTFIGEQSVVIDTRRIENCWIGPGALVRNATLLSSSTLLSSATEKCRVADGVSIGDTIVQGGAQLASSALVDASVLCDHCRVERQAKVSGSLIGPNSNVGLGEITASLIGPLVGFQHQALLIAALWPDGKGNVGHGANIGSNHTGRAPDQEIRCGEGIFFGLGVNVKYPADFTRSPYSILATAVVCPPQRVEFPFSLINTPAEQLAGVPNWINEILPGWVLLHNAYALKRSVEKFRLRDTSRNTRTARELFHREIIDFMLESRGRLAAVTGQEFYTSDQIRGLGKNYLTEKARRSAIDAYDLWIDDYCLQGLKDQLLRRGLAAGAPEAQILLDGTSNDEILKHDENWEHSRAILASRHGNRGIRQLMDDLLDGARRIAECVERSKAKDWSRGTQIISDYDEVHDDVSQDPVVRKAWKDFADLEAEVRQLVTP